MDGTELTGHPKERLPGLLSVIVREMDGNAAVLGLDLEGIAASMGAACTTGSTDTSHVLAAMGYPDEEALGALRLSLGRTTTEADIDAASEIVPRVLGRMRAATTVANGAAGTTPSAPVPNGAEPGTGTGAIDAAVEAYSR